MIVPALIALFIAHFACDFLMQSHWQATNKARDWRALATHVATYSTGMTVSAALTFSPSTLLPGAPMGPWSSALCAAGEFGLVTLACHGVTDAITSRINARLWARASADPEWYHWFFVGVGLDQLLHHLQIIVTVAWLIG